MLFMPLKWLEMNIPYSPMQNCMSESCISGLFVMSAWLRSTKAPMAKPSKNAANMVDVE